MINGFERAGRRSDACVLASVVRVQGSTYRRPGLIDARMEDLAGNKLPLLPKASTSSYIKSLPFSRFSSFVATRLPQRGLPQLIPRVIDPSHRCDYRPMTFGTVLPENSGSYPTAG